MKHGSGIKDRDDKSSGIEIRIAEALAKINPTDPLILAKQAARRNRNCSDSSGNSLARAEASRCLDGKTGCYGSKSLEVILMDSNFGGHPVLKPLVTRDLPDFQENFFFLKKVHFSIKL
jgi:hypothetical protein